MTHKIKSLIQQQFVCVCSLQFPLQDQKQKEERILGLLLQVQLKNDKAK